MLWCRRHGYRAQNFDGLGVFFAPTYTALWSLIRIKSCQDKKKQHFPAYYSCRKVREINARWKFVVFDPPPPTTPHSRDFIPFFVCRPYQQKINNKNNDLTRAFQLSDDVRRWQRLRTIRKELPCGNLHLRKVFPALGLVKNILKVSGKTLGISYI